MMWTLLHIADLLLWLLMAGSVVYVLFFAVVSLFYRGGQGRDASTQPGTADGRPAAANGRPAATAGQPASADGLPTFLVLFPAYHEDAVILYSVRQFLGQDYPRDRYHVAVISDHMSAATNDQLRALPITLHQPVFERSSKARALQYAMAANRFPADYVVIMDADNVAAPDFLTLLSRSCRRGYQAIQCHRCAKNSNNDIAVLDGVSEEINNTLFRRAHNVIGMSSALIGSGMCFSYSWFSTHVGLLSTAVEDRELEALLMREGVYIRFENDIPVYDEKVSNADNFQRQRLRWMTGQLQALLAMLPYVPRAVLTGNVNYLDKTVQQALIPRSILLVLLPLLALVVTLVVPLWGVKWWVLFALLCLSLFIAIPARLRTRAIFSRLGTLPRLVVKMLRNVRHLDKDNKEFIHTTHTK